jgi:hypothetical protein
MLIGLTFGIFYYINTQESPVTDFASCIANKKSVIRELYPRQCVYKDIVYTEDIPKQDIISTDNGSGIDLNLPKNEKAQIEAWLEKNEYNQYGDSIDTVYMGGTPLFDEAKGIYIPLYDYLLKNHPDKPWLEKSASEEISEPVKSFTEVKVWENFEDPNFELQYPDFSTLVSDNGYPVKIYTDDGFEVMIYVSENTPQYSGICTQKLQVDALKVSICHNNNSQYQDIYQRILDSFVAR